MTATFTIDDLAKLQVEHLPRAEKQALRTLFDRDSPANESVRLDSGDFVARMGTRRVLWRPDAEGRPIILGVLDRSYAASS